MANLIEEVLRTIFPESQRLGRYCAYGRVKGSGGTLDGLEEVIEMRARGESRRPVLIYGFEPEERIRQNKSGSILDAAGVFYLRLPALLSEIEAVIEKIAYAEIPTEEAIDEKSFRDYAVKEIRAFKHRLDNVSASMEMNANRARKELERSPDVMPRALAEFKSATIRDLLSEYRDQEELVLRLGVRNGERVSGMMSDLLAATRQMEDKETEPSDTLDLAFRSVALSRAISRILEQVKEL